MQMVSSPSRTFPLKLEDSPAYALGVFPGKSAGEDLFTLRYRLDATGYTPEQIQGGRGFWISFCYQLGASQSWECEFFPINP